MSFAPHDLLTSSVTFYEVTLLFKPYNISQIMWAIPRSQFALSLAKRHIDSGITFTKHPNKMHQMTFDPDSDLILGLSVGQQGKISSGVFAYSDQHIGTL